MEYSLKTDVALVVAIGVLLVLGIYYDQFAGTTMGLTMAVVIYLLNRRKGVERVGEPSLEIRANIFRPGGTGFPYSSHFHIEIINNGTVDARNFKAKGYYFAFDGEWKPKGRLDAVSQVGILKAGETVTVEEPFVFNIRSFDRLVIFIRYESATDDTHTYTARKTFGFEPSIRQEGQTFVPTDGQYAMWPDMPPIVSAHNHAKNRKFAKRKKAQSRFLAWLFPAP